MYTFVSLLQVLALSHLHHAAVPTSANRCTSTAVTPGSEWSGPSLAHGLRGNGSEADCAVSDAVRTVVRTVQ